MKNLCLLCHATTVPSSSWLAGYERRGRLSGTLVPPLFAAELDGVEDHDPVALGSDQFFGAKLAKDSYHDLTNRADRVGYVPASTAANLRRRFSGQTPRSTGATIRHPRHRWFPRPNV